MATSAASRRFRSGNPMIRAFTKDMNYDLFIAVFVRALSEIS